MRQQLYNVPVVREVDYSLEDSRIACLRDDSERVALER